VSIELNKNYELQTQVIARQLLDIGKGTWLEQLYDQITLEDKLVAWVMGNPGLQSQLFNLIETLPKLTNKTEVTRHLQECLAIPTVELPKIVKRLLNFVTPDSIAGQIIATIFTTAVSALARKYIAGDSFPQVLKTAEKLRRNTMAFTIDRLGEAVITEQEAQNYLDGYLDLMTQLSTIAKSHPEVDHIDQVGGQRLLRVQISIKLTTLYSQFDLLDTEESQHRVSDRLRILLRRAQELRVAVHFDMEQYRYKDLTLKILKSLLLEPEFHNRSDIGVTLQAYLRDSYRDLEDLINWTKQRGIPITVRLVKGAYWDQEKATAFHHRWSQPVYNDKGFTDANFERMTELLLQNHDLLYAAIASHNPRSQAKAIAIARALDIPRHHIEHQVLYGMADKLAKAMVKSGCRVRIYCPYGSLITGISYLIRRLLENTANTSILRQSYETKDIEVLLLPPTAQIEQNSLEVEGTSPRFHTSTDD
jgi:RHH-type transcriptional regulator, proline utilization regulon repressor / proline dehydrogenase / delta 1-pyrroline-5-carboxylate dehydrogenase